MKLGAILLSLLIVSTAGLLFQRYTQHTKTTADDAAGNIVGYWANFIKFVVGVIRGKIK
jgi:hypothetical protein